VTVLDREREVLGDLVAVDDAADPLADQVGRGSVQTPARRVDRTRDLGQLALGRPQEVLALAGSLSGDVRVAADDRALAEEGGGADLGE
jgi:hypothetical protein